MDISNISSELIKQIISRTIIVCVALFIGALVMMNILAKPRVYFSYSTGLCTMVVSANPRDTCERLPETYIHNWEK